MLHAIMTKENSRSKSEIATMRVTRARARTLGQSGGLPPLHPSAKQEEKRVLRSNFKRAASDENKSTLSNATSRHKRRAVLGDVTNLVCETSYMNCINATKIQDKKGSMKRNPKVAPAVVGEKSQVMGKKKENMNDEPKVKEEQEISLSEKANEHVTVQTSESFSITESSAANLMPVKQILGKHFRFQSLSQKESRICPKEQGLDELGITDIDSKHKDPLMCGVYASHIYRSMNAMELDRRPSVDYMDLLQRDITQSMRGILIDWLVEVTEEYRLVPDTLYLTVNLIDRFLSGNYIEKQKLQLLGVTCMLIASKYEEICAPRVEEFCFITDNTYTKEEVVKMESKVLNSLDFRLSVPTTKKFLRRFIQAAQVSYEVPSVELEFLANYLAELTLQEYSFLKFLPSLIAASAVFLARWTIDQSDNPWNPTLEHYTNYKVLELKTTVIALQDLQLNTSACALNAIREKYKQVKFKSVATLRSSKPVQSLF
ncbi:hypothetical protein M9H77_19283 [Catharanthus roseus]|uniref:Uncharacterized protein n=1 Tax=Catharanthus roseus TaxID=4058 RepID=A0ACC0B9Y0_CATRO|nr:hypothetical protein M9H77_19283 [Catharanthus roseus]